MPRLYARVVAQFTVLSFVAVATAHAQVTPAGAPMRSAAGQPKIIVVPYTTEDQNIRTVLQSDFNWQLAVARVKKAFDTRHFSTIDFEGALAAMKRDQAAAALNQSDFLDRLLENNRADMYVKVNYKATVDGGLTSVAVIMDSHLTANGMSMGTETARSRRNQESDVSRHIEQAIDHMSPAFLDNMQSKFDEFQESGVPLVVELRLAPEAKVDFNSKPKGNTKSIADLVEDWADANALNHGQSVDLSTKNQLHFSEIRVPIREANGAPLSQRRFGSRLTSYLETLGVNATASVNNGTIYVDVH